MSWISTFHKSSIGSKLIIAVTGLIMLGFLVGHLTGNLLIFAGKDAINSYAEFLKANPMITWPTRILLIPVFVLHLVTAIRITSANRAARPVPYAKQATVQASLASRAMIHSGIVIGLYVIYHLLHFTFGVTDPQGYAQQETLMVAGEQVQRHDVYAMVIAGFKHPMVCLVYVIANAMLAWHLSHGISSMAQTLGLNDPRYTPLVRGIGLALAALIGAGYISIPLSVLLGLIQ